MMLVFAKRHRDFLVRIRDALQEMVDTWNSTFDEAEDIGDVFCLYVSPFPSTMVTARQLHAAALPLKGLFYGPLRGRRSTLSPSRYRSLKVGASKMPLRTQKYERTLCLRGRFGLDLIIWNLQIGSKV